MSNKKRLKKGIESLDKQIKIHIEKIKTARGEGNEGLIRYHEKEIENFNRMKDKKKRLIMPKLKRTK